MVKNKKRKRKRFWFSRKKVKLDITPMYEMSPKEKMPYIEKSVTFLASLKGEFREKKGWLGRDSLRFYEWNLERKSLDGSVEQVAGGLEMLFESPRYAVKFKNLSIPKPEKKASYLFSSLNEDSLESLEMEVDMRVDYLEKIIEDLKKEDNESGKSEHPLQPAIPHIAWAIAALVIIGVLLLIKLKWDISPGEFKLP